MDGADAVIRNNDEEPWRTALDIIAARGYDAEMYVIKLASSLAVARCKEEVWKLSLILDAIETLRREAELGLTELGFAKLTLTRGAIERRGTSASGDSGARPGGPSPAFTVLPLLLCSLLIH